MKNQKIKILTFVVFTSFILSSCFKNDQNDNLEVFTDAYVIKKMVGDNPGYAVTFFAYGNQLLRSATVTQVGNFGEKINLGISSNSVFVLTKQTVESDFKTFLPAASEYDFTVTSESGLVDSSSDVLKPKGMEIPAIEKAEFKENNKLVDISWATVEGADGYVIKIVNSAGSTIYNSEGFEPTTLNFTLNILMGNWAVPVESGNTYTLQVHAFAFEEDVEELYAAYNIEEIAIGEKNIVWP